MLLTAALCCDWLFICVIKTHLNAKNFRALCLFYTVKHSATKHQTEDLCQLKKIQNAQNLEVTRPLNAYAHGVFVSKLFIFTSQGNICDLTDASSFQCQLSPASRLCIQFLSRTSSRQISRINVTLLSAFDVHIARPFPPSIITDNIHTLTLHLAYDATSWQLLHLCTVFSQYQDRCLLLFSSTKTRGQSNLTKSASRGAHSPVRGHPRGSKVVPLNSWGRVSY